MLDHLHGGDVRATITGMRQSLVRQLEYPVQFVRFQWNRRRIQPDLTVSMRLNEMQRIMRIGLLVKHPRGVGIKHRILGYSLG